MFFVWSACPPTVGLRGRSFRSGMSSMNRVAIQLEARIFRLPSAHKRKSIRQADTFSFGAAKGLKASLRALPL